MGFLYSLLLKLLYPTSICLVLLGGAVVFRRRRVVCRACFSVAVGALLICGNGWVVRALTAHLEWEYPSLPYYGTTGRPDYGTADCIVVLSGGIAAKRPPRPTVEISDGGDRLLYGAYLFRKGRATHLICTGNVATGGIAQQPAAEDMAEFLEMLGIPRSSIVTEIKSENTHEHAKYLYPIFQQRGFKRVLLVTSAMHMPRSVGVFRKLCPGIEIIPAPTDFRVVEPMPTPWYRRLVALIPTPRSLLDFCEVEHEYLGIAWYKLRGWM